MVRPKLQGLRAIGLVLLACHACASPDANRLEQPGGGPQVRDAGHGVDAAKKPAPMRDAGSAREDGGTAVGGSECAAAVEFPECERANALTLCSEGKCLLVRCQGDYVDCDGDPTNGCEATLESVDNCGLCRAECRFANAQASCAGGECRAEGCDTGFGNCDDDDDNGCETSLDSARHCGGCGAACDKPDNAVAGCVAGACGIGSCAAGFGDCNATPGDGCEQVLKDAVHCGACDTPCAPNHGSGDCATGTCMVTGCDTGFVDCNGLAEDGCETADANAQDCCATGTADCDGDESNGCEATFDQVRTCGTCKNDCLGLAHVTGAQCNSGSCETLVCDVGWADCDGLASTGCETSTRTLGNCGSCGTACAPAHATASCDDGQCRLTRCDTGFDDCNGNLVDGCETSLSQPATCGSCSTKCPGNAACLNGNCMCTSSADCSGGKECCDGVCQDTRGTCFPWPCIPGTATGKNAYCGGCNEVCGLWCCF